MTSRAYDRKRATQLLPLLRSIAREIQERTTQIARLDGLVTSLRSVGSGLHADEIVNHQAEAATHKRGLRSALLELERLGCSVEETRPLTIRIPGAFGDRDNGYAWRAGDPALSLYSADSTA